MTTIGGLMWMTFFSSSPGAAALSTEASATGAGAGGGSGAGGGATGGGGGACGPFIREIGGRTGRLVTPSRSVRLGRGFFSSIKETDSTESFGVGGFGAVVDAGGGVGAGGNFGAVIGFIPDRGLAGAVVAGASACEVDVMRVVLVGASIFAFLVSFLADAVAGLDETAALTGFFVAGLRAAVLLVVLVGIFSKNTPDHFSISEKLLRLCGRGLLVNCFMDFLRF